MLSTVSSAGKAIVHTSSKDLPVVTTTIYDQSIDVPNRDGASGRALAILEVVAKAGRPMPLADITEALNIPKGTVHRLCSQLVDMGFLSRDVDGRSYGVGKALCQLALSSLNHRSVQSLRHQVLTELVDQVKETCNFTTLDGDQIIYLDRVEAQWPLRLTLEVGSHVPLHCTASGKILLAHTPRLEFDRLLRHMRLKPSTPHSITDVETLEHECRQITEQGYSTDREEFIMGLIAVAVPVKDSSGNVRAAVAMHAPTARMSIERAIELLPHLRKAAAEMGSLL